MEMDRAIRTALSGLRGEVFLHRSCVPLNEADLFTAADHCHTGALCSRLKCAPWHRSVRVVAQGGESD